MPLLFSRHPASDATFAVWQIAEPEAFFRDRLPLSPAEVRELEDLKGLRRMEWLACRWLLHAITGEVQRLPVAKDAFAKPFFMDRPDLCCSLSHSHGLVGALFSKRNGGCDLQAQVDKMPHIAPRFLNTLELDFIKKHPLAAQLDLFHLFWTMKESLYKAYGLKELDFKTQLRIAPFVWDGQGGETEAMVVKSDFQKSYGLRFEKNELPKAEESGFEEDGKCFFWTVAQ